MNLLYRKGFLSLKNFIIYSAPEIVVGLVGRHPLDDGFVKFPIITLEFAVIPDPQQLRGEQAIEGTISGILVILTSGNK